MKTRIPVIFLLFYSLYLSSQTGPAGVGSSSNNVFWLKADKGPSSNVNNTAITTWSDQSGNGIDVTQTVAVQQPSFETNVINGFPAIQFDNATTSGQNDKMIGPDSPILDNTSGYTFFTVTRPQNFGDAHVIVSKRTTVSVDQSFMLFYYTGNKLFVDIQTTDNRFSSNASFSANTNYLIDVVYDGSLASGSRSKVYTEETLDITAAESSTLVPDNSSPIILGTTDAGDPRPYGGYMSEIIIYREALVPPQRIIVNNYLSSKYNIALSANDKYLGDTPANGDYDREVAGVGIESTGSNMSFSASVSGGIGISVTSGLDNGDYILAGHAVLTNAQNTTDVGGMTGIANARWLRTWYVDVTNVLTSIGTNIEFDMSDGGMGNFTPVTASNYVLLYRAGQTGNWTELATASSIVGDRILFNGIVLTLDGYYTLGSKNDVTSILPIELVNFDAVLNNNKVSLVWSTASEKNNAYFTVEKTSDGKSFESVAVVNGKGNSSTTSNYTAEDLHPYKGLSYYRLRQTDYTQAVSYSKLVAVNDGALSEIIIYPNPSDGIIYVNTGNYESQEFSIQIRDSQSKICFAKNYQADKRGSIITVDTGSSLAKGAYIVTIKSGDKQYSQKIIFK